MSKHAVNSMRDGGCDDCVIMNVNSTCGHEAPMLSHPGLTMYIASKHAVSGITSCLRGELSAAKLAHKIRVMVSCCYPGVYNPLKNCGSKWVILALGSYMVGLTVAVNLATCMFHTVLNSAWALS